MTDWEKAMIPDLSNGKNGVVMTRMEKDVRKASGGDIWDKKLSF